MSTPDAIGWAATAVFTASYLTRGQERLRRVQMAGATLWLTYGLVIEAPPVIGSNILVLSAACWAEYRQRREARASLISPSATVVADREARDGGGAQAEAEAA
ncbi:hypothetical protein TBR22_A25470 [Luteitalea sp. TBR-22]|uniref:hypothetical protein n=1 Tax=Luteitalea sp. TBR-22 TaxID=2802971 RepID=UPI001AF67CDD|nr:hypothetical protein [Luteitalea sp. TBR-22]BCS33320.1 hypothetical protein TBR22_A25470 [Luteitalea sp. TBR-22]